jgi:hypothetical protein
VSQALSLSKLLREREELQKDLLAFKRSYDVIRNRVNESLDSPRNYPPLYKWSGTRAVMGSLEMAVLQIEQNVEQYGEAINMIRSGDIENTDKEGQPTLGVLEGGKHEL